MLDSAKEILNKTLKKGDKIAIALSGGMDSMCLFSLVLASGLVDRSDILVLNVNHSIRGDASDEDSKFSLEQAKRAGVCFLGEVVDVPKLAKNSGKSIETEARHQRQLIYKRLIAEKKVDYILLGHHADDQAETVLMHIFRGCGMAGLRGMSVLDGQIFRPLLDTKKSEIEEYIQNNNIPYVSDWSNFDSDYNRNYLRNEIMPKIKERWSGITNALARLSKSAAESQQIIDECLDESLIFRDEISKGVVKLSTKCLQDNNVSHYVFRALSYLGVNADIERKHVELIKELKDARNGAKLDLTSGIIATKEYDKISFQNTQKVARNVQKSAKSLQKQLNFGVIEFLDKRLIISKVPSTDCDDGQIFNSGKAQKTLVFDFDKAPQKTLVFDFDKVPREAVIRTRQEGDIFKAVGRGTKKLKDFLIDKKIPQRLRDQIPCLCYKNEVLLIFGLELSERIKIEKSTTNAAKAELLEKQPR